MPIYDKEKYESYIHSVMDKPRQTKAKPDAPSPIMTPNNMAYYGSGMNQNQMFSHENMMDNVMSYKPSDRFDNYSQKSYKFKKYPLKHTFASGFGFNDPTGIEGTADINDDGILHVYAQATNRPGYKTTGVVNVTQNGQLYSTDKLKLNRDGYFMSPSASKPVGDAYVKLPKIGKYDVELNVIGEYDHGVGHTNKSVTQKLPFSK